MRFFTFLLLIGLFASSCEKTVEGLEEGPVQVYPNPFDNVFGVYFSDEIDSTSTIDIRILDGSQDPVYEAKGRSSSQNLLFNMEDKKEGVYFFEANIDGRTYTQQILKIKF